MSEDSKKLFEKSHELSKNTLKISRKNKIEESRADKEIAEFEESLVDSLATKEEMTSEKVENLISSGEKEIVENEKIKKIEENAQVEADEEVKEAENKVLTKITEVEKEIKDTLNEIKGDSIDAQATQIIELAQKQHTEEENKKVINEAAENTVIEVGTEEKLENIESQITTDEKFLDTNYSFNRRNYENIIKEIISRMTNFSGAEELQKKYINKYDPVKRRMYSLRELENRARIVYARYESWKEGHAEVEDLLEKIETERELIKEKEKRWYWWYLKKYLKIDKESPEWKKFMSKELLEAEKKKRLEKLDSREKRIKDNMLLFYRKFQKRKLKRVEQLNEVFAKNTALLKEERKVLAFNIYEKKEIIKKIEEEKNVLEKEYNEKNLELENEKQETFRMAEEKEKEIKSIKEEAIEKLKAEREKELFLQKQIIELENITNTKELEKKSLIDIVQKEESKIHELTNIVLKENENLLLLKEELNKTQSNIITIEENNNKLEEENEKQKELIEKQKKEIQIQQEELKIAHEKRLEENDLKLNEHNKELEQISAENERLEQEIINLENEYKERLNKELLKSQKLSDEKWKSYLNEKEIMFAKKEEELSKKIKDKEERFSAFQKQLENKMNEEKKKLENEIKNAKDLSDKEKAKLQIELEKLEKKIESEKKVADNIIKRNASEIADKINTLEKQKKEFEENLNKKTEVRIKELNNRADMLFKELSEVKKKLKEEKEKNESIEEKLKRYEKEIEIYKDKKKIIETRIIFFKNSKKISTIRECFRYNEEEKWIPTTRGVNLTDNELIQLKVIFLNWKVIYENQNNFTPQTLKIKGENNILAINDIYEKKKYFGLREGVYYNNELIPTRRGINIEINHFPEFISAINEEIPINKINVSE